MITFTDIARLPERALRYLRRVSSSPVTSPDVSSASVFEIETAGATLMFVTTRGAHVAGAVKVAATFQARYRGLLDSRLLWGDEGLLLSPGGSVHTFGMRYAIDVLFLDRHMRVLKSVPRLQPWRVALAPGGTTYVLELAKGRIAAADIHAGARLLWSEVSAE